MSKNPYIYNPVAKMMIENYHEQLLENEKVDAVLAKLVDNSLTIFQKLAFDLAPKRERNPDLLRVKLSKIANSKTVKELASNLEDEGLYDEIGDHRYAEVKNLYIDSLKDFTGALKRASEIDKSKDDFILKKVRVDAKNLQSTVDLLAKRAEDLEKKRKAREKELNESEDAINEGLFTGYKGRVRSLKKLLTNLIASSEGKNQKNGYGKDWKQLFIELEQKVSTLDTDEGEIGTKNKNLLEEVEKDVKKYQTEFNNSLVKTSNRVIQNLEDEEEVYTTYLDVKNLFDKGIEELIRANAQYEIVSKEISDERESVENEVGQTLFPIRKGDVDTDKKFKGSGLIYAIQSAIVNGIPAAGRLIRANGGPNGKFGSATQAVITTIQKISGNKNANGEIDKNLLDDIVSSDWVSKADKAAIHKAIDKIKGTLKESFVPEVKSMRDFLNEEKIVINNSSFEKELAAQYKEIAGDKPSGKEGDDHVSKKSSSVNALAKKLRSEYSIKIESDDFLRSDGNLKSSYSPEFISAWSKAIDSADPKDDYSYFYFDGGVYNINLPSTSLKNACNWKKWADVRKIGSMGNEDLTDFVTNYLKGWTTFGMVRPQWRYDGIKELLKENSDNDELDLSGAYEKMDVTIKNGAVPFIDYDNMKGEVKDAFKIALQSDEKNPDLTESEFVAINNFLVMVANAVTFDGSKFVSCIKWIHDNVMGESTSKRIAKDNSFSFKNDYDDTGKLLGFESSRIIVADAKELYKRKNPTKGKEPSKALSGFSSLIDLKDKEGGLNSVLGQNLYYISADIYPSVASHVKRMNATSFEELPQNAPFQAVDADTK